MTRHSTDLWCSQAQTHLFRIEHREEHGGTLKREEFRTIISDQFYRSLDQSEVTLESIPHAQLQAIVGAMADGVFAAFQAIDEESPSPKSTPSAIKEESEEVLWEGKPQLILGTRYELTTQRLRIFSGIFSRELEEIDLVRVRDSRVTQNLGERALNMGDVVIVSTDPSRPEFTLESVKDPMEVREIIRSAYLAEQKRRGLTFREE
jgi:Bacterial PH domain